MDGQNYRPLHGAHAIQETVFIVQFTRPFESDELRPGLVLEGRLKRYLPSMERQEAVTFALGAPAGAAPNVQMSQGQMVGLAFKRTDTGGNIRWMLRFTENVLTAHTLDYQRWAEEWERARRFLKSALQAVKVPTNQIVAIGLRVIDRFVYAGPRDSSYSADGLFKRDSKFLAPVTFSSGLLWHCHSGWFDDKVGVTGHFLNQLNVGTNLPNGQHVTTIDHNQLYQSGSVLTSDELFGKGKKGKIDELMTFMHEQNKSVMIDLLTLDMAKRVRLTAPTVARR